MELYQHFQDTKRRCGWAARRYTVKLHANNSPIQGPGWKFNPGQSAGSLPASSPTDSYLRNEESNRTFMPVPDEMSPSCSKTNINLLRALLTFAAKEVRPPASLCTGSVRQLLVSLNENIEFPTEAEISRFLSRHQLSIETLAFAQLPLVEQSVVVLSLHGQLKDISYGSQSNCLIALWNCFISNGTLQKALFSIRRYPDAQTAIFQALSHLDECRDQHKRSLRVRQTVTFNNNIVVLSVDPSHYLQLPLISETKNRFDIDLISLQTRLSLSTNRLLDDFCCRLWRIFIVAVENVEFLPRLLTSVLKFASREAVSNSDWSQSVNVFHLRQLSSAMETLSDPYSPSASVEVRRQFAEYKQLLETVLNAGQFFESAIQRLHRSGVSAGSRLPLLLGLQKKLGIESSMGLQSSHVEDLRRMLVSGLEKTFAEEVSDSSKGETSFSLLATFADPQYKLFWVEDPEQEAIYRDRIVKHLTAKQPKVDESSATPLCTSTSSSPSSCTDIVSENGDGLLDFVAKRRRLAISSAGCEWPIMDEVQTYLGNHEEAGPLDFWANVRHQENYPNVYKLHLEVHAVPASCLDTSLQLGLTPELFTRVATSAEWQRETDEVTQCLILAKSVGYEFGN